MLTPVRFGKKEVLVTKDALRRRKLLVELYYNICKNIKANEEKLQTIKNADHDEEGITKQSELILLNKQKEGIKELLRNDSTIFDA